MTRPSGVDGAVDQRQTDAFGILGGIEGNPAVDAAGAGAGKARGHLAGTAGKLGAKSQVERMQALVIAAAGILGHADHEDGAVGAGGAIDDRRRRNADLGDNLAAVTGVGGGLTGAEHRRLPLLRAGVGVDGVDTIVLGDHVENVDAVGGGSGLQ